MSATCKSCGAAIVWAKTAATGKAIPLDAEPVADGNLVLSDGVAGTYIKLRDDPQPARYKSHFATCAFAAHHRKRK